jgi:hypothetical protein
MSADLPALIARVEAATGPDYDIDREIWRAVDHDAAEEYAACETPAYTASLDAAVSLVPSGCKWSLYSQSHDEPPCAYCVPNMGRHPWPAWVDDAYAATPALALCAAALKARQAMERGDHG